MSEVISSIPEEMFPDDELQSSPKKELSLVQTPTPRRKVCFQMKLSTVFVLEACRSSSFDKYK